MNSKWEPGRDLDEEFEESLSNYIIKIEHKEKSVVTAVCHILVRNGIYTYKELKERIEHSEKVVWYENVRDCGYERSKVLENYINYVDGKPVKEEPDDIKELKAQIKELQTLLRIKQQKTIKFGDSWYGIQKYPSTRPNEYYIAIGKPPVEYDKLDNSIKTVKIFVTNDKKKVLGRLDKIIEDLTGLRDKLKGEL